MADRGGKYLRFEDLPVWQAAIDLGVRVFALSATGCFQGCSGLRDQIERAAVSISSNIAEGYERGTSAERLTFLYIARGSAAEVRSLLILAGRIAGLADHREALEALRSLAESVSRQLGAWTESVKNSDHQGQRYQNDATRRRTEQIQRRDAFQEKLRQIVEDAKMPTPPEKPG